MDYSINTVNPESKVNSEFIGTSALLKNYARYEIDFQRGEGSYLFDQANRRYLDFLCGIAVTGFGHNHPQIKKAVERQFHQLWHVSNLFQSHQQEELAQKLTQKSGLDYAFFCNSGTEANEAAIKFARKWGQNKTHIIATWGGFHGRTLGSLSATGQEKFWQGFGPLTPGFSFVPFGEISPILQALTAETVAILVEPIQGENGIIIPPVGYLKTLRTICDQNNLLLILDEVQSGMGRTGKIFASQWEDVVPDIMTMAKGIANGLPLGVTLCSKKVGDLITPGSHGSTFGGNPLAIAAANEVMNLLTESTLTYIQETGNQFRQLLKSLNHPKIKCVRGRGFMIGVELQSDVSAKKFALELLNHQIIVGTSGETVLRIYPPFIASTQEINYFVKSVEFFLTRIGQIQTDS